MMNPLMHHLHFSTVWVTLDIQNYSTFDGEQGLVLPKFSLVFKGQMEQY